jgi:hypothetical protein
VDTALVVVTLASLVVIVAVIVWVTLQLAKRYGWWSWRRPNDSVVSEQPTVKDAAASAEIWDLLHGSNIVRGEWLSGGLDVHLRVIRLEVGEIELERVDSSAFTDRMPGTMLTVEVMRVTQGMIAIRTFTREVAVGSARVVPRPQEQVPAGARSLSGTELDALKQQLGEAKLW